MVVMQRELDRSVQQVLQRLQAWLGALLLAVCLLFGLTSWRMGAGLATVVDDRVVPLHDLQRISLLLNASIPAALAPAEPLRLREHAAEARRLWAGYLQTYLTPEEQGLARAAGQRLAALLEDLERRDGRGFAAALPAANGALAALLDLQVRVARHELQAAQRWSLLGLVGALLCLLAAWRLRQHAQHTVRTQVVMPLRTVADAVAELAEDRAGLSPEAQALSGDFAEVGEQLRRLDRQLQERRALQARTEALLQQLQGAQIELLEAEKLASLGSLVAGVSHELNTPLGVAVTVSSSLAARTREFQAALDAGPLRRSLLDSLLATLGEGLELLQRNLDRAAALLRSFKQVAVDRSGMQRRRFDLRATLDELLASLRPVYGRHGAEFRNEVPAGILVDGYPGEFGQVISNLVVNAVVHGFDGGAGLVRLRLQQQDAQGVQLLVEDNGCGMSPEVRARAFDPFFTTRLGQGGSGLGLAIARNLTLGALGGRLQLESEPGRGTRFLLHMPLQAPERNADERP
jgi:signal transduction histidine kinase